MESTRVKHDLLGMSMLKCCRPPGPDCDETLCPAPVSPATAPGGSHGCTRRSNSLQTLPGTGSVQKSVPAGGDRFIPNRRKSDLDAAHFKVMSTPGRSAVERELPVFSPSKTSSPNIKPVTSNYKRRLDFVTDGQADRKLLSFSSTPQHRTPGKSYTVYKYLMFQSLHPNAQSGYLKRQTS